MQETINNFITNPNNPFPPFPNHFSRPKQHLHFPSFSSKTNTLSLPSPIKPPISSSTTQSPPLQFHHNQHEFKEKMLYLDSIGLDFLALITRHSPIVSVPLSSVKSTVDFLSSMAFTGPDLRRIFGMCPDLLTIPVSDIVPVFTFLFREVHVEGSQVRHVINRRPRLLACSVKTRLRPTLYFLQSIGIHEVHRHTYLLSCSVEDKLMPRIDYLEKIGFSHRDVVAMVRRFPQLFCYSIENNFEPKFDYFVVEMGRDLNELKEFPQYFSYSLEHRIKLRHQCCVEKGVCFPLRVMLKTKDAEFRETLEVCCNSSIPFRASPLWCTDYDMESLL